MAEIASEPDLDSLRKELEDRFGALPHAAENLLYQLRVKILAQQAGVDSVAMEGGTLVFGIALDEETRAANIHSRARYSKERLYVPFGPEDVPWRKDLIDILFRLTRLRHREK